MPITDGWMREHITLWECQVIAIEHGHLQWVFILKMVSFHSYVNQRVPHRSRDSQLVETCPELPRIPSHHPMSQGCQIQFVLGSRTMAMILELDA